MNEQTVTVSAKEFAVFINAIQNVSRNGASLTIHPDHIDCLILGDDNMGIMLYTKMNRLDEGNDEQIIHIKDLNKFQILMDMNNKAETFTFKIRNNAIYFENNRIKGAKFFLDENPSRKIAKRITAEWFNNFTPHFKVDISRVAIKEITSLARFASSSEKVYFYEKDNTIIAELNDKEEVNIDNISVKVSDEYDGHINGNIILGLDSLSSITNAADNLIMQAVDIGKREAMFFTVNFGGVLMKYLFQSLVK